MRILIACASAAALAASLPALAQGNGNGNRGGGGNAQAERGGGSQGNAQRGNRNAERGGSRERGNDRAERRGGPDRDARGGGNERGNERAERGNRGGGNADRGGRGNDNADRGNGNADRGHRGNDRADRGSRGRDRDREARGNGHADRDRNDRRADRQADRRRSDGRDYDGRRREAVRIAADRARGQRQLAGWRDRDDDNQYVRRAANIDFYRERRWSGGDWNDRLTRVRSLQRRGWQSRYCPPGLARQNELCMPPGQYRKLYERGARFDRRGYDLPDWYRISYRNDPFYSFGSRQFDYRYADGYAYRLDPQTQLVAALLPVLGGALGLGQTLPSGYNVYNLPTQYRPIYRDDDYHYRYGDGAIYRVDPGSRRILGISELVNNDFVIGRPMPAGYGAYNVPYGYRTAYYDTPDNLYRYNAGRIYQVDPETRLVRAAIDLFT